MVVIDSVVVEIFWSKFVSRSWKTTRSKDRVLNGLESVMVNHHPGKFGGHRHGGSEDMFLVVEQKNSTWSCLNPLVLFISKAHGMLRSHTRTFVSVSNEYTQS